MQEFEDNFPSAAPQFNPALFEGGDVEDSPDAALLGVLAELGESDDKAKVNLYRIPSEKGKPDAYITSFQPSEFDMDAIALKFGGGTYRVRVYNSASKLSANKIISIEAPKVIEKVEAIQAPALDVSAIVSAIAESGKQQAAILAAALQSLNKPQETESQMLNRMMMYKELFGANQAQQAPQYNPVELLKTGIEIAQMGGDGGGNNAWVSKALETFAPLMGQVLAQNQAQPQAQQRQTPRALPQAAPKVENQLSTQTEQTQPTEDDPMNLMMRAYIGMLSNAAKSNASTEEWANNILDNVPAAQLPEIEGLLRSSDWQEKLAQLAPAVNQYPQWFSELRDTVIFFIDEDKKLTAGGNTDSVVAHDSERNEITGNNVGQTGDDVNIAGNT